MLQQLQMLQRERVGERKRERERGLCKFIGAMFCVHSYLSLSLSCKLDEKKPLERQTQDTIRPIGDSTASSIFRKIAANKPFKRRRNGPPSGLKIHSHVFFHAKSSARVNLQANVDGI